MNRTRRAGTRALVIGLSVAAVAAGSAAAATPAFLLQLHARLAPVAATTAAGRFDGQLVMSGGKLPSGSQWRLTWRLDLPALNAPVSASLRIRAANGAAPVVRTLCTQCATSAKGTMAVTGSEATRILRTDSVVVVRSDSATLRGTVKASVHVPVGMTN